MYSIKIRKSDLHQMSDRNFWIPIIKKGKTKPDMCILSLNDIKNKKSQGSNLILDLDKKVFNSDIAGNTIPNGDIECEISIRRIVDVGDFSKDSIEVDTIQGFWQDEIKKPNVEDYNEKQRIIYIKESNMSNKIVEAVINESKDFIGRTDYFDASLMGGEIKLTDLNGNYTMLSKEEIKEFIALLKKCEGKLK